MPMIKNISELRQQEGIRLRKQLAENSQEQIKLRLSLKEGQTKDTSVLRKFRRERARLLTVLKEKEVLGKV